MREQLIAYVDLLFAGAADTEDIKQEILQNTLDRYDDLLDQGKTPQAAYSLAIAGIGDVSELLRSSETADPVHPIVAPVTAAIAKFKPAWKRLLQAVGICLYILCPIPLIVLQNELGLCGLLFFVGAATALMILTADKKAETEKKAEKAPSPNQELRKAIRSTISIAGLCCYFIVSFLSHAWHITWLIFPITGAVQGLVKACLDIKEAHNNET